MFTASPDFCNHEDFDTFDFGYLNPQTMCCACGGGEEIQEDNESDVNWLESGLLCRASDYRTVASNEDFDVISV